MADVLHIRQYLRGIQGLLDHGYHLPSLVGIPPIHKPCFLKQLSDGFVGRIVQVLGVEESGKVVKGPLVSGFRRLLDCLVHELPF